MHKQAIHFDVSLNAAQILAFNHFYDELLVWNKKMNLTAITGWKNVQTLHFLDALSVVPNLPGGTSFQGNLIDVGSGCGIPGIPIKLALPKIRLTLLDSIRKKVGFLRHMIESLRLDQTEVIADRAENLGHITEWRESFDVSVARALGPMAVAAELCLPLTRVGGMFIAQKKGNVHAEVDKARPTIEALGGELIGFHQIEQLPGNRVLVLVRKNIPSPARYPRRAGIPAKRPLLQKQGNGKVQLS